MEMYGAPGEDHQVKYLVTRAYDVELAGEESLRHANHVERCPNNIHSSTNHIGYHVQVTEEELMLSVNKKRKELEFICAQYRT